MNTVSYKRKHEAHSRRVLEYMIIKDGNMAADKRHDAGWSSCKELISLPQIQGREGV